MTRRAACRCGQLVAHVEGEPVRVSVCHCHDCQRRSGSAFAAQARFRAEGVTFTGDSRLWERTGDSGRRAWFRWCPACGGDVAYTNEGMEDVVAILLGAFDPGEAPPAPWFSVYESRKQPWVEIVGAQIERD